MQAIRSTLLVLAAAGLLLAGGWGLMGPAQPAAAQVPAGEAPALARRVQALETAVAALEQDHAALAVQVAQIASTPSPAAARLLPAPTLTPTPAPTLAADEPLFEILSVDGRITESNNVWWKYAYIVEVQNTSEQRLLLNATIEFLDADGFLVDDDFVYGFLLEPGATDSITGYALIDAAVAPNVEGINAKVGVTGVE